MSLRALRARIERLEVQLGQRQPLPSYVLLRVLDMSEPDPDAPQPSAKQKAAPPFIRDGENRWDKKTGETIDQLCERAAKVCNATARGGIPVFMLSNE